MKKLLLASTTALVASAGIAAADVNVTGDGRMGVVFNDALQDKVRLDSRARVRFNLSGETDTGLAFGGWFRAQTAGDAASGNMGQGAGNLFISGDFGRLSFGDVMGAAQGAVGDLHQTSLTGLGFLNENIFFQRDFNGGLFNSGGTNALYTYSIDGFTVHASLGQTNVRDGNNDRIEMGSIGARYEFDGYAIGAGYELTNIDGDNFGHLAIGGEANIDMFSVRATIGRLMQDARGTFTSDHQVGISGSFNVDPDISVSAFVRRDFAADVHIGAGASYDLGGGASLVGGMRYTDFDAGGAQTLADFGVSFSF